MNRIKRAAGGLRRAVCLFMALLIILTLLPQPEAWAAGDSTIRLTDCDFTGLSYHSQAVGNASIHSMQFSYDGGATGFCYDHGKGMGRSLMGQSWSRKEEITDPTIKLIMAYYYSHTLNKFTDKAIADGMNYPWDDGYTTFMNAWT